MLAKERGVDVLTCGDTEVALTGDDGLLRQMVSNLLDNAIVTPRESVTVTAARTASGEAIFVCPMMATAFRSRIRPASSIASFV